MLLQWLLIHENVIPVADESSAVGTPATTKSYLRGPLPAEVPLTPPPTLITANTADIVAWRTHGGSHQSSFDFSQPTPSIYDDALNLLNAWPTVADITTTEPLFLYHSVEALALVDAVLAHLGCLCTPFC